MSNEDPYLEFVIQESLKIGKRFYIDSGEGREFDDPTTGWNIEDLSGWLIEPSEEERFLRAYKAKAVDDEDEFDDNYIFAIWSLENGDLKISFVKY